MAKEVIRVRQETYLKLLQLRTDLMKEKQENVSMDDVIQELLRRAAA